MPEDRHPFEEVMTCGICGAEHERLQKCLTCLGFRCPICEEIVYRGQEIGVAAKIGFAHASCVDGGLDETESV